MPEGLVFDVQRFSTHDGPGIRTTVFFAGCGLRCLWCHNPESWHSDMQILTYPELCIACGRCVQVCEPRARRAEGERIVFERRLCKVCGKCAQACPAEAVRLSARHMAAEEVVEEILRDRAFYERSGGGVTLSGGEPLLQAELAAAILERCVAEGLHTAIETAGYAPWSAFETVLPWTRLLMLDVKLMDPGRHRETTGADNELILANARSLVSLAVPVVVRMPIVPGVNDNPADVRAVARFAASLPNINGMELMRFHASASRKVRSLGIEDWAAGKEAPTAELMNELVAVARAEGLETRIG